MKKHTHKWKKTSEAYYTDPLQYKYKCNCGETKWIEDKEGLPTIHLTKKEFEKRYKRLLK